MFKQEAELLNNIFWTSIIQSCIVQDKYIYAWIKPKLIIKYI